MHSSSTGFVQEYNWDDGAKKLFEVIRHPQCDRATALLVYWQSQPDEFAAYPMPADAPPGERKRGSSSCAGSRPRSPRADSRRRASASTSTTSMASISPTRTSAFRPRCANRCDLPPGRASSFR
ncbi:MAG: DUF4274 domain-containing protein, partial [Myxococcales bacterium]|nr:DUF4274 domain-containing protein [Myxococcales bacterium]